MIVPRGTVLENLNGVLHRCSIAIILMERNELVAQDNQCCRKQKVPGSRSDVVAKNGTRSVQ